MKPDLDYLDFLTNGGQILPYETSFSLCCIYWPMESKHCTKKIIWKLRQTPNPGTEMYRNNCHIGTQCLQLILIRLQLQNLYQGPNHHHHHHHHHHHPDQIDHHHHKHHHDQLIIIRCDECSRERTKTEAGLWRRRSGTMCSIRLGVKHQCKGTHLLWNTMFSYLTTSTSTTISQGRGRRVLPWNGSRFRWTPLLRG